MVQRTKFAFRTVSAEGSFQESFETALLFVTQVWRETCQYWLNWQIWLMTRYWFHVTYCKLRPSS